MVQMASTDPTGVPVAIPQDVLDLIRRIFADGNAEVSGLLSCQPMSREDHSRNGFSRSARSTTKKRSVRAFAGVWAVYGSCTTSLRRAERTSSATSPGTHRSI